ncbi:MAG TPA: DinB family protein [Bryobacteraceae bacterium]|nr:DinB family protein [Bryobacteraceae bacterium]
MNYLYVAISDEQIPKAVDPVFQHAIDTYAAEMNKVASTWREFSDADLAYKPHEKSSTVAEILKHGLLSERRFFAEFLGSPEPAPADVLPAETSVAAYSDRFVALCTARLAFLASRDTAWWLQTTRFFDVDRQRIWIFWRRVLHTAHHRTQLTVYLRLLDKPVPSTYGPTADVTWTGADPTTTVDAAGRR